jgi:hypothetical protein
LGINAKCQGNRLGIFDVGCSAFIQRFIVGIYGGNRTMSGTIPAPGTDVRINVTRTIGQGDLKIARLSRHFFNFAVGNYIYVVVPADLDQFG